MVYSTQHPALDKVAVAEVDRPSEVVFLIREVERYLAAVALYRELGCEPTWRT